MDAAALQRCQRCSVGYSRLAVETGGYKRLDALRFCRDAAWGPFHVSRYQRCGASAPGGWGGFSATTSPRTGKKARATRQKNTRRQSLFSPPVLRGCPGCTNRELWPLLSIPGSLFRVVFCRQYAGTNPDRSLNHTRFYPDAQTSRQGQWHNFGRFPAFWPAGWRYWR